MTYSTADARQELLDGVAGVVDELGRALADVGEAYELVDDTTGDRLEEELFGPVQKAYGAAKRTYAAFAARHGLGTRDFPPAAAGHPSQGVKGFLDGAVAAAARADGTIVALQDAPVFLDVADAELRAGLAEVRRILHDLPTRARAFTRTLGR